jgi:hypothetical protein
MSDIVTQPPRRVNENAGSETWSRRHVLYNPQKSGSATLRLDRVLARDDGHFAAITFSHTLGENLRMIPQR